MRRVPVAFFSMVMGIAGLGLAFRQASDWWDLPGIVGRVLWLVAVVLWPVVLVAYVRTARRAPTVARGELLHHGTGVFAALAFMSLMLLTIPLADYAERVAETIWFVAAIGQAVLGAWLVNRWIREPVDPSLITGGWLLPPTGGNLVAGIGAAAFGNDTLAYMFLGAGTIAWIFVNAVIFNRQVTYEQGYAPPQRPTAFIQVAPPVLIVNALVPNLSEDVGPLAYALWGFALFALVTVLVSFRDLAEIPFGPHWWAMTFPSAALALASIKIAQFGGEPVAEVLAPVALVFATVLIVTIAVRTVILWRTGKLLPTVPAAPAGTGAAR